MAEVKKEAKGTAEVTETVNPALVVKLSKEYDFEGEKVTEIDFSGLEDATARTMMRAYKIVTRMGENNGEAVIESTLPYIIAIAEECTKYPAVFYERLSMRDAIKVKVLVLNFFNGVA